MAQSGRFAMEWQTKPNSYCHKNILSLLIFDRFSVVFMLFDIKNPCCCKTNIVNYLCEFECLLKA